MMKRFIILAIAVLMLLIPSCVASDPWPDDIYTKNIYPGDGNYEIGTASHPYSKGYFDELHVSADTLYLDSKPLTLKGADNTKFLRGDLTWQVPTSEGSLGPQGSMGPPGPQGEQGIQGVSGEPGATGQQGAKGDPGAKGDTGEAGIPGPNEVTAFTSTNLTGILRGNGNTIAVATNYSILDATQEPFTTALKTSYDWLVTNITSAWKTTVDNHIASTSNPHSVTKSQVGLGTVTNDAQIAKSLADAKGDILTATADDSPARLAVGSNTQVLTADSTTATGLKWATPSAGGESEIVVVLGGDIPNATTTLANATGLTFSADANSIYVVEVFLLWDTSATTVGIKVSATASGSPTITAGHFEADAASGTPDSSTWNANDVVVTTSASPFTTYNMGKVNAVLKTAGSTSTWQLRFAAETTGTITIKAGSVLRYRKIT